MPDSAALPTYATLYAFGDSLSDAGNLSISTSLIGSTTPVSPPYYQEQYGSMSGNVFSNGPTWVQNLSVALGVGTLTPSLIGGGDFAYGGAETGLTPQNENLSDADLQAISLPSQLGQFEAAVANPSNDALYTLSIGSNDVLDVLHDTSLSTQQQTTDVTDAVDNEIAFVKQLAARGASNLIVLDVPDLGKTPDVMSGAADGSDTPSAAFDSLASQLAGEYNAMLATQLAIVASAGNLDVTLVDAYQLIDSAVADPSSYNLSNVTTPVWSGNFTSASSGSLATSTPAAQDQYLFWDSLHPTETGHTALTNLTETDLTGPAPGAGLAIEDTTTAQDVTAHALPYLGPVSGLDDQYLNLTTDNLNISANAPNLFIHTGSGTDAIAVASGSNVLDGGTGSNFLTGGSGSDTFFVDDRNAAASIWSTLDNFHAGDAATIWGITQSGFEVAWSDAEGASGYTGLTLHATAADQPTASLTLVGYSQADLTSGRLSVSYGTSDGSAYLYIHANS